MRPKARLVLEDGTIFDGQSFGSRNSSTGEVVFNTSLAGYQEVLTDPSYRGQIVTMTYPQIGNYGINTEDSESTGVHVSGFVIRDLSPVASNFRSQETLEAFLERHDVPGICGIDTRALVRRLRSRGAMRGIIDSTNRSDQELMDLARNSPSMVGRDLVREVASMEAYHWQEGFQGPFMTHLKKESHQFKVVALDYGMKSNIPRCLVQSGCTVRILPGTATSEQVLAENPDGIFLSNGPGDPEAVTYGIKTIRSLLGIKPMFGICLGHQLLALALGAQTFKLKFGHRGANHPVLNQLTGKVEITTQNHGFAVDPATLPQGVEATHINLNDQTLEGIRHQGHRAFSVQYHPEASAGPHDSRYLFGEFVSLMGATAV
ncbi:MAG: carbamoyl-phosphate synthase small subunit [Gemmataceae bacterium]|nr:carbamoyl-phosphate synthase small subunit [Gemmataceae bacterium]